MSIILRYIFVSGSSYSGKDEDYDYFDVDKPFIERYYEDPFEINNIKYFDGTHPPKEIHPSSSHKIYGSGGAVLDTNVGKIAIWGEIESDPNPEKSHAEGLPHINFYIGTTFLNKKLEPKKCRITICEEGLVITKNSDLKIVSEVKVKNK
jgi:hypothetical protein